MGFSKIICSSRNGIKRCKDTVEFNSASCSSSASHNYHLDLKHYIDSSCYVRAHAMLPWVLSALPS